MTRTVRFALVIACLLTPVTGRTLAARQMEGMEHTNDFKPFTREAFKEAQTKGTTTLLFFHAPWCPVCKAQEPKVQAQLNGPHKDVMAFKVDYDSNVALRQEFKVDKQSTLILYQGMKEVARLSYKSDDQSIAAFFSHAAMGISGGR
jgi:thioredoxin 1